MIEKQFNYLNWITPIVIALGGENQMDVKRYCLDTFKQTRFLNNFGWYDPFTFVHLNTIFFGGFDMVFAHVIGGGQGVTSGYSLLRSTKRKCECFDFNEWLPALID
eukprot:931786_1